MAPKQFPQIRILHLSDLHFGANNISTPAHTGAGRAGIPSLMELVRRDLQNEDNWKSVPWAWKKTEQPEDETNSPLLMAITGDLTQKAVQNEFDDAIGFIRGLTSEPILGTRLDIGDVFVVPGNHDIDYTKERPDHRFPAFCTFYNELFKEIQPRIRELARPTDATSLSHVYAIPAARVVVAEINSCLYVEKETEDESRGQVDFQTIAALRGQLENLPGESKSWIKIALVHHHPVLLPSFIEAGRGVDSILNSGSLLDLLRSNGFQMILHGHKHYPQIFSYDPDSAWAPAEAVIPQLIIAGGSAGSKELPDGTKRSNTYNLITIKWNAKALQARVQVVTRALNRTGDGGSLPYDQWKWITKRVFDKVLSPYEGIPLPGKSEAVPRPSSDDDMDLARGAEYRRLRYNVAAVEVLPSLLPRQGYEARVWLMLHRPPPEGKSPRRVIWSAGKAFPARKVVLKEESPDFCVSFHYWGPMLIQARLEFEDGSSELTYIYARLPDSITRR